MSRASRLSHAAAEVFLNTLREEPCEYGHLGCSTIAGGTCTDELLGIYPDLA